VATPLFQHSNYVKAFLSEKNPKQFTTVKKRGAKEKKPDRIEKFASLSG
jgi:hypothetical protein